MALRTVVTELPLLMIRIRRCIEICRMTIPACVWQLVLIVRMTLIARHCLMRADQRKCSGRVTERRRTPHGCTVAWCAVLTEAGQYMTRIRRLKIVRLVTLLAVVAEHQLVIPINMALSTLQWSMRPC